MMSTSDDYKPLVNKSDSDENTNDLEKKYRKQPFNYLARDLIESDEGESEKTFTVSEVRNQKISESVEMRLTREIVQKISSND